MHERTRPCRMGDRFLRKIAQGFERLQDFLSERNYGVFPSEENPKGGQGLSESAANRSGISHAVVR